jgi:hypothetical protein
LTDAKHLIELFRLAAEADLDPRVRAAAMVELAELLACVDERKVQSHRLRGRVQRLRGNGRSMSEIALAVGKSKSRVQQILDDAAVSSAS